MLCQGSLITCEVLLLKVISVRRTRLCCLIAECHSNTHRYPVIKQWFLERYPEIAKFGLSKFEESQNEIAATAEQPLKVA